ncbi:MAG: ribosomal protein [Chlorobi bacterium]|nr:ribosomal protein [Chlorobiota bacterium]
MQEEQNQSIENTPENEAANSTAASDPLNLMQSSPAGAGAPANAEGGGDAPAAGRRKTRVGLVVSDKMNKSIVVTVVRRVRHPLYKKYFNKTKRYMAHDEQNECHVGDTVRIIETRPLSAHKRWRLDTIVEKAK